MMKKVLLMLGGGYHPFKPCGKILADFLTSTAGYDVVATEDRKKFTKLDGFDAVVIYTQGGKLTPAQERGLLNFVKGGGGLVGIHCANDSFTENAGYMEMIGSQFAGHGSMADIRVEHTDDYEEIVPRLAKSWIEFDEFYILKMRTTKKVRPFQYGWWEFDRKMLGYVRPYGRGRVLYTGLGHDEVAFRHPEFQDLMHKAIRYVTREKETPLRWGIVGYGPLYGMGLHHAEFIRATAGMKLVAVCDKDPARLEAAKEELGKGLKYFLSTKELVKSQCCDGVTTIVPHNVHASVTAPLLDAGLHAITEKPFAITPEECDQMIDAAKRRGVVLSVYHSRHWDSDMWTIREIVESGAIGEVFSIQRYMCGYGRPGQGWRSHKPISGGLLYDMGAHGFEKIFQIVPRTGGWDGRPIKRKAVLFGNFLKKVWWDTTCEDHCRAYVKFDSGLEAQVTQSNISAADQPSWIVLGTKGSCVSSGEGIEVKRYVDGALHTTMVPYVRGLTWQSFYRNFADHLHAGVPLIITPGLAKAAIQCIHGCEIAARENRLVEVEFDL